MIREVWTTEKIPEELQYVKIEVYKTSITIAGYLS